LLPKTPKPLFEFKSQKCPNQPQILRRLTTGTSETF